MASARDTEGWLTALLTAAGIIGVSLVGVALTAQKLPADPFMAGVRTRQVKRRKKS